MNNGDYAAEFEERSKALCIVKRTVDIRCRIKEY